MKIAFEMDYVTEILEIANRIGLKVVERIERLNLSCAL